MPQRMRSKSNHPFAAATTWRAQSDYLKSVKDRKPQITAIEVLSITEINCL